MTFRICRTFQFFLLVVLSLNSSKVDAGDSVRLTGAGATFPAAIYSKWFEEYHKAYPNVEIAYQAIGSGVGIRKLLDGSVDFGASDGPMTDEQMKGANGKILHFPTVLGAVVPISNIDGVTKGLRFTPDALAGIYLGRITQWNDPEIANANPGVPLPQKDILVVHRTEGSGTTFIWTDYLSKVSAEWEKKVGRGTSVRWPVGLAAKGNEGVAELVKQTPNSIGYVELTYAIDNQIDFDSVRNAAGAFVKATVATVTAAGDVKDLPHDFRVSIANATGEDAYPIASFTWLLVPAAIENPSKRKAMADLLRWMIADGQALAGALSYAPLPKVVVEKESEAIAQLEQTSSRP
jgi:phosphate transport system substrate-binding protein